MKYIVISISVFCFVLLILLVGNSRVTKEEASDWEWNGKLSSLKQCGYRYIVAGKVNESGSGFGYKSKAILTKEHIYFPSDCKTVYNWCNNNWQEDSDYYNKYADNCSFEVRAGYSCSSAGCEEKWYAVQWRRIDSSGTCTCTLDKLEEGKNWYYKGDEK